MLMLTVVSLDPLTLCVEDLLLYDPLMVSYSNQVVVDNPSPFTVPFNVAEFAVTFVADPVVAVGAPLVFNVKIYPLPLAKPLESTSIVTLLFNLISLPLIVTSEVPSSDSMK